VIETDHIEGETAMDHDLETLKNEIRDELRKETQQTIADNINVAVFILGGAAASYTNGYGFLIGAIAGLTAFCIIFRKY
jgi:hypothetical protein